MSLDNVLAVAGIARDQFLHENERRTVRQAKIDNRFRRVSRFPHARELSGRSAANEISELPAPVDTTNARAVTIVVERWLGELRWRNHVIAFLYKFFRKNAL